MSITNSSGGFPEDVAEIEHYDRYVGRKLVLFNS